MLIINRRIFFLLGIAILVLAACAPQAGQIPVTDGEQTPTVTPPEAVLKAQKWLAAQFNAAAEQVQIIEVEHAEWSDSCLGLGRPDESCALVITPGWRAVLEINGQRYEVRTDESGSVIRLASPEGIPPMETGLENTHWSLVSFGSPGAERPLVEGSTITLMFAGGQAGGFGGCNSYGSEYRIEGNSISFEQIVSTLVACAEETVTRQEQEYFQALGSASSYEISGNQLMITYDEGLLVFEKALSVDLTPASETPGASS